MSAATYSIRDAMRRKRPEADPDSPPAVARLPMSCGEFIAQWPLHAGAAWEVAPDNLMFPLIVDYTEMEAI